MAKSDIAGRLMISLASRKRKRAVSAPSVDRPPTQAYLKQAIVAVLAGRPVAPAKTEPYGCALGLDEAPRGNAVTFHQHIEPLLQVHYQECHHTGGGGPFALETYKQAKGWARDDGGSGRRETDAALERGS